jgi:hypothetical protein
MEHWSAIYALVARRRIHDFTLRKSQSDRLLVYETALECIVNEQSRAHSAQGTGPLYHLIPQRSAASNDSGRRRYFKWRVPPMPTYALARIRMDPV